MWSDAWFTPTAQNLCAALERILTLPGPSVELYYDPTQIMFLQEDRKDEADINATKAQTARQLIDGGFEPSSVVQFITNGDPSVLTHTGNVSVQLQPPGTATNGGA